MPTSFADSNPAAAAQAIEDLAASRNLSVDALWQAVADALLAAYNRLPGAQPDSDVSIDTDGFTISVISYAADPAGVDVTPEDFGRIAAAVFKQAVREFIDAQVRALQLHRFEGREDTVVYGRVVHVSARRALLEIEGVEGVLPASEQIPNERLREGDRIYVLILALRESGDDVLVLSRSHPRFVTRMLEEHISEIADGRVQIVDVAREAGRRSKVAVALAHDGPSDPAGIVIGPRGSKINMVTPELGPERLDIISWDPDLATFVANALGVDRSCVTAVTPGTQGGRDVVSVVVPADQAGRAVGTAGVNVRLAERLCGVRIDLQQS